MYLKKMKPNLKVTVVDNRNEKVMSMGGPGSCKGCLGGISGFLLEQLAEDFNITLPRHLINNRIRRVKFVNLLDINQKKAFEIDLRKDLVNLWDSPNFDPVLVSVGNGKGKYNHPNGMNISFDYFLRTKTKQMGVNFINGYVNEILVPNNVSDCVTVRISQKRPKSTLHWFKKDSIGSVTLGPEKTDDGDKVIIDASLVINATGLNSRNRIELGQYSTTHSADKIRQIEERPRAKGKIMGMFDIDIEQKYLEKKFGNTICVYSGIEGANVIVAAPKYLQQGGSWLTVAILPRKDIEPEYDNMCDDGGCSTIKPQGLRREMEAIRDDFLHRSGLVKHLSLQTIKQATCRCTPIIPHLISAKPYGHRYVEIGDASGAMKYGRNGITYAFKSAKRAVEVALTHGISDSKFRDHYDKSFITPIRRDNLLGRYVMKWSGFINRHTALANLYYILAKDSPLIKKYAVQILVGVRDSDNYTRSTLSLIKDSYGGMLLIIGIVRWFIKSQLQSLGNRFKRPQINAE
jgi:flavin-dependent dehydrogenase